MGVGCVDVGGRTFLILCAPMLRRYVNAFVDGAAKLSSPVDLPPPSIIDDTTVWAGFHPFSSFLDGVRWDDQPVHPLYSSTASSPTVTLVSDDRYPHDEAPMPTHDLPDL